MKPALPERSQGRRPARKSRKSGQGALFLIALLLGGSGLLRFGLSAGNALANADPASAGADPAAASPACEPDAGALACSRNSGGAKHD